MHAVLRLIEHDGRRGLEHFFGDLHAVDPEVLECLFANFRVSVVKRWKAMHEFRAGVAGSTHYVGIDLIGLKKLDALRPDIVGFAHRNPDVRMKKVCPSDTLIDVICDGNAGPGLSTPRSAG